MAVRLQTGERGLLSVQTSMYLRSLVFRCGLMRFALAFITATVLSSAAFAQGAPPAAGGSSDGHNLDLAASVFASYSDNVLADVAGGGGATGSPVSLRSRGDQTSGVYSGLSGNLKYGYAKHKGGGSFVVNARSSGSFYPDLDMRALQHLADLLVSRQLGQRTSVRFSQSARAADQYRLELFPDMASDEPHAVLSLSDEFGVLSRKTYAFVTSTGISHKLTNRATFGVDYAIRQVNSPDLDFNFRSHIASVGLHYRLTRYGGIRANYSYREATRQTAQDAQPPFKSHDVGLGIDYNRAFSLSGRRYHLDLHDGILVGRGRPGTGVRRADDH